MSITKNRARVAGLLRVRSADDPEVEAARRDLRASVLEKHVADILAQAPPLTDEQRERIAGLLRVNPARPQQAHADLGLVDSPEVGGDV